MYGIFLHTISNTIKSNTRHYSKYIISTYNVFKNNSSATDYKAQNQKHYSTDIYVRNEI
jgi:hypothetical protein